MPRSSDTPAPRNRFPASLPTALLGRGGAFAGAALAFLAHAYSQIQYETLPDLLARGSAAFERADYPAAASAFRSIRENYAEEPAWESGELPAKLLPLAGYASFKSGDWDDAASALAAYLSEFPEAETLKDLSRFTLAQAHASKGDIEAALLAYGEARQSASAPAISAIAAIQQARLIADQARPGDALAALEAALAQVQPGSRVHTQARLAALQIALDQENLDTAREALLGAPWRSTEMPELATLSFLAFEAGDRLLEADRHADALRAYRLVWPRDALASRQRDRLDQLLARYRERAPGLALEQRIWVEFYQQVISRLTSQLQALEAAEDYENALLYRKARCFALLDRPAEAWLILEKLSLSGDPAAAAPAHRDWISLAQTLEAWRSAATIARSYLDLYPGSDDATSIFRSIGFSLLELQDYEATLAAFESALQAATRSADRAVASYYAGFCLAMLERHEAARAAFQLASDAAPSAALAGQATLWIGITRYLENAFDEAIEVFASIEANPDWAPLIPEARFRKAVCEYAADALDEAQRSLETFLADSPGHARDAEAYSLLGDIHFDLGDCASAVDAYSKIPDEDRQIACHGALKIAECALEQGAPEEALAALARYAELPVPADRLGAFYSFWAQTLADLGQRQRALEILSETIDARGAELEASGIPELVLLQRALDPDAAEPSSRAENAPPTLAARFVLAAAREAEAAGKPHDAERHALRLASDFDPENLPPECLAAAGLALVDIGSRDGAAYLERIIEAYPTSNHVADARFGLALRERQLGDPAAALRHIESINPLAVSPALASQSLALKAELLSESGRHAETAATYEQLLGQRALAPAEKARALVGLGDALWKGGDPLRAYACFERVFTLYRAEQPLVADSYLHCARILQSLGQADKAQALCREFLDQADLVSYPAYAQAESLRDALAATP